MSWQSRIRLAGNALLQLGPSQLAQYGLYQLGLRSGHYRRVLNKSLARLDQLSQGARYSLQPCLLLLPDRAILLDLLGNEVKNLYEEADEIINGQVRLFGGQPVPLVLASPGGHDDWTKYETNPSLALGQDLKFIWEPGRFGWAFKLAMAYHSSQDERYADAFWRYTGKFFNSNLPYDGPQWSSAQEVAIRLLAMAFAVHVFAHSHGATRQRMASLAQTFAIHAERIPPTLVYARSQKNNHLITEALGLYTAAAVLPEHPLASRWHHLGWKWLMHAFRTQISADGTYIQHSTNYHRLMLQAAMWAYAIHDHSSSQVEFPHDVSLLLKAATRWLWKLLDPGTGRVPNLGHNDGAYMLPLSVCPYHDYRPVVRAAAQAFLNTRLTPAGTWDDMAYWLFDSIGPSQAEAELSHWRKPPSPEDLSSHPPYVLVNHKNGSWGALQVATYHSRPAHADQMHLDLWWRGFNLAQDAGTYMYSAPPPWENALTSSFVHNTVVVDGQEFMQHTGKFLYLDWAQGKMLEFIPADAENSATLTAEHNGYRKMGISHRRKVIAHPDGRWEVVDQLDGPPDHLHTIRLHWLLPDWEYEVLGPIKDDGSIIYEIHLLSPQGKIALKTGSLVQPGVQNQSISYQLVRASQILFGAGVVNPIIGWISPTYGEKIPALASIFELASALPVTLRSEWVLPDES